MRPDDVEPSGPHHAAPMNLTVGDPIAWVKRNPAMFFPPDGRFDVIRLLGWVMADVLAIGRGDCQIGQRDGWWFVTSDADWLVHELGVQELFVRVVVAPAHGAHSMRAELLVNEFARDAVAFSAGQLARIKGCSPDGGLIETILQQRSARAMIAFRLPT